MGLFDMGLNRLFDTMFESFESFAEQASVLLGELFSQQANDLLGKLFAKKANGLLVKELGKKANITCLQ
jgi:hypothetical protein